MSSGQNQDSKTTNPEIRRVLLHLEKEDQAQIRNHALELEKLSSATEKERASYNLAVACHKRAEQMINILRKSPRITVDNIGLDGCKAVCVLTLHSYIDIMEEILSRMRTEYSIDPNNTYQQGIPPLEDRIAILKTRLQIFGTNWMVDKNGKPFLIKVRDFANVNHRRAEYGLGPIRRPVNLSLKEGRHPLGRGYAKEQDQKELTEYEYQEYSRYYLQRLTGKP